MVSTVDLLFALARDSTATDLQFVQESTPRQLSSTCGRPQRLLLHTRFSCDLFDQKRQLFTFLRYRNPCLSLCISSWILLCFLLRLLLLMNLSLCGDTREAEDHADQRCCISCGSSFLSHRSRLTMSMGRQLGFGETSDTSYERARVRHFLGTCLRIVCVETGPAWDGPAIYLERFH